MDESEYLLWRQPLDDGHVTTVYAVRHPRRTTSVRVVHFPQTERLDVWCAANDIDEAIVGGFFVRDPYRPLGELWIAAARYPASRSCRSTPRRAPAWQSTARTCASARATALRRSRPGNSSRPARCSCARARS
ncbi:MAG: hypothetical protein M5U27_13320 [Gaiella sp.]|nr:hypothetical protein [Gaiella sp.]